MATTSLIVCNIELPCGDFDEWKIPQKYKKALEKHVTCGLTNLHKSWPVSHIPMKGDEITLPGVSSSHGDWVAGKKNFQSHANGRIRIWVQCRLIKEEDLSSDFDLHTLLSFAHAGFKMESGKTIRSILRAAKLPLKEIK